MSVCETLLKVKADKLIKVWCEVI